MALIYGGKMKKSKLMILIFFLTMIFSCQREKNPVTPPIGGNIHPQVDIPWPSLANSPWPMFHHDPQSTGRSPYRGPREGKVKWVFRAEGGINPAVVIGSDSTIYFTSSYERRQGKDKSSMYALNPDGSVKWRFLFDFPDEEDFAPLVAADGTIILATSDNALDFINPDGTLKRKITLPYGVGTNVNIGKDGTLYFRSGDGYLYAMTQTGEILWRLTTDNGIWYHGLSLSPDGSTLYLFSMNTPEYASSLCAVSTGGKIKWKYAFGNLKCYTSPTIDSYGNIIFGTEGIPGKSNLYFVSPEGKLIWKYPGSIEHEPAIDRNGFIFFATGRTQWDVKALDWQGRFLWAKPTGGIRTSVIC
ncbi:MAG TPA: hypothetical protein ENH53_02360, partial [Bacteroidetes bacterium]|nr:hypothetical protein [Bacteroidota bacterium]